MSLLPALSCCLLLAGVSSGQRVSQPGSDWYLRFFDKRDDPRLEIVSYHVTSSVNHRYSITKVEKQVYNPFNSSTEYLLSTPLPSLAVVTHVDTGEAELHWRMRNETAVAPGESPYNKVQNQSDTSWKTMTLPLLLKPGENATLSVTYEEVVPLVSPSRYRLEMLLDVGEIVRDGHFSVLVELAEERQLRNISVISGHPVIGDITNDTLRMPGDGDERQRTVNFTMNTREQACYYGSRGVHGSLVLEYSLATSSPQLLVSSSSSSSTPLLLPPDSLLSTLEPSTSYMEPKEYEEECQTASPTSASLESLSSSSSSSSSSTSFVSSSSALN